ncbi:MAG: hypothetical protein HY880_05180 [Deltaproteobacteria bacterium]|nr:hypothetical protein [Deltaproteobacteria bacterium]
MIKKLLFVIFAVSFIFGCAGKATELQMKDTNAGAKAAAGAKDAGTKDDSPVSKTDGIGVKTIVFPNGTIFGGASRDQASELARIFVDSHNMSAQGISEVKDMAKESLKNQDSLKHSADKLMESTKHIEETTSRLSRDSEQILKNSQESRQSLQKNSETAQKALQIIEQLSRKQGTGEITIFFPTNASRIKRGALEYERLVRFIDYLSRESKGRKVLFISIGSASAFGDKKVNSKLAMDRSEFPVKVIDKYLVNIPHEFHKVYGIGDQYSPKGIPKKEHTKYQHTRIIALYETDQAPELPAIAEAQQK